MGRHIHFLFGRLALTKPTITETEGVLRRGARIRTARGRGTTGGLGRTGRGPTMVVLAGPEQL